MSKYKPWSRKADQEYAALLLEMQERCVELDLSFRTTMKQLVRQWLEDHPYQPLHEDENDMNDYQRCNRVIDLMNQAGTLISEMRLQPAAAEDLLDRASDKATELKQLIKRVRDGDKAPPVHQPHAAASGTGNLVRPPEEGGPGEGDGAAAGVAVRP